MGQKTLERQTFLTSQFHEAKRVATDTKIEFKLAVEISLNNFDKNVSEKVDEMTADLKNMLMNKDMWEAFDTIGFLIDNVRKFDMDAKEYESSVVLLLAILKKVQDVMKLEEIQEGINIESFDKSRLQVPQLSRGKRFGKYALNVYPASWETEIPDIAKEMGIDPENVLLTKFKNDDVLCPMFILLLDHEVKSVVLAVRGTYSLKDVVIDMVCDEAPYLNSFAHKGILSGANKVWAEAGESVIRALANHPGYSLVVTGHSLGAGVAELVTLELLLGEQAVFLPEGTDISCVALGPPPVFRNNDFESLPNEVIEKIDIFINNDDCFPRMSLGSLTRLLFNIRAIDSLGLTVGEHLNILSDKKDKSTKEILEEIIQTVKNTKQDQFPFLQHPGKIFYLKKEKMQEDASYIIREEKSRTFTWCLYLNENMVTDHRKPSYEEALGID